MLKIEHIGSQYQCQTQRRRAELVKTSCPASFALRKDTFMNFLKSIFGKKEPWVEFETLYSTQRLERLRTFMAENNIPYKVRAALLPVPLNTPMPSCAASHTLWYVSVHPADVHRVEYYLRTERSV